MVHGIGQSYEELTFRSLVDCGKCPYMYMYAYVIPLWSVISAKIGALVEDGDFSEEGALIGRFCGRLICLQLFSICACVWLKLGTY